MKAHFPSIKALHSTDWVKKNVKIAYQYTYTIP